MPSLSDQIDHLASAAKSISSSAQAINAENGRDSGTFTRAVLSTPLGDLIRDIDSSELGLFTVVQPARPAGQVPPDIDARGIRRGEISRVEFTGATPLKKPPSRRDEMLKPVDFEPEVYAQAALKYLDRYQSIRPMPRARSQVLIIVEQLARMRDNIRKLNDTLQQAKSTNPTRENSVSQDVNKEEERIQYLQNRLVELRKQRENKLRATETKSQPNRAKPPAKVRAPVSPPKPEPQEENFWNTPAASARTLRFTDNLLKEEVDLEDVSMMSFTSPVPPPRSMLASIGSLGHSGPEQPLDVLETDIHDPQADDSLLGDTEADDSIFAPDDPDDEENGNDEGDPTIVLKKPSASPSPVPSVSPIRETPPLQQETSTSTHYPQENPLESAKKPKFRSSNEMDRIVVKIWSTVGEIIMPGQSFDASGSSGSKPPRSKETLEHLRSISAQDPSPASPTGSSLSSFATTALPSSGQPTTQQVLIAHLLLTLLSTQPAFSMSLSKLKEALAEKFGGATGGTRALYACVAKKLIRIERGGGEQTVKFDV